MTSVIIEQITKTEDLLMFSKAYKEKMIKFYISKLARELNKDRKTIRKYLIWNYNKDTKMSRAGLFFFNKIYENGNIDRKITAHRLRKTFATRLLKEGCPLTTIQKLLGHTDVRTSMKYLQIDKEMLERDYFKFYPYKDL